MQFVYFEKFIIISFYLFPFTFITGPLLPDLLQSISCILFLFIISKKKSLIFLKNKFFIIFLIFCSYITLRSIVSGSLASIESSIVYFRHGLYCLAIYYFFKEKKISIKKIYFTILLLLVILNVDALFQYFYGYNIIGIKQVHAERVSSFFGDELILGSFSARLFPVLLPLLLFISNNKISLVNFFLIIILNLNLIILSSERTALVMFVFFVLLSTIIYKYDLKKKLYLIIILILSFFLFLFFNSEARNRIITKTERNYRESTIFFAPSKMHSEHYETGFKMFKNNIIFGVGVKNFRNLCNEKKYYSGVFSCSTHPHNLLIQFLAETGLIGLTFLVYFYYTILKYLLKFFNKNKSYISVISLIILINFQPFLPYGNVFNNWLSMINFYTLMFIFLLTKKQNRGMKIKSEQ